MYQFSVWEKESFLEAQDIIIIGSGFTGLWSALYLKELHPLYKITLLERGVLPTGASTRNAGFSCFGSPTELLSDSITMGEEKLWQLVEMRYKGLQLVQQYFGREIIDYDPCGGYECFTAGSVDWELCNEKLDWLNDYLKIITGEDRLFKIADDKIAGFGFRDFKHLIANKLEAGLHPGKLVQALLQKVQSLGVKVLTGIEVKSYEKNNAGISIYSTLYNFQARQILLCTNAFTGTLIPGIDIIPNRGQVLVTEPISDLSFEGTFHFDKGYYYFRNLGKRLLLGGGRNKAFNQENTQEMQTTSLIQEELEQFIHQYLLPNTGFKIADRWSGIMAMGSEKMPIVKIISEDVFCCVRMSGMGVALAPVVAQQVATLMDQ